jgi:hypothetical protein
MPGTMTYVGFDVHARSAHAAAIDVMTGSLCGCGSGPGSTRRWTGSRRCRGRCGRAMRPARPGTVVPSPQVEAAREVVRAHDACRRDLMNARHRVSKMLLRHGRVYPKPSTWTQEHRRWLAAQQFPEPMSTFTYADLIATVEGVSSARGSSSRNTASAWSRWPLWAAASARSPIAQHRCTGW